MVTGLPNFHTNPEIRRWLKRWLKGFPSIEAEVLLYFYFGTCSFRVFWIWIPPCQRTPWVVDVLVPATERDASSTGWGSWRSIGIKILRQMVLKAPNRDCSEQSEYVLINLIKTTYFPIVVGQVTPYLDNWYQGSLQDRPTERAQKCHGPTGGELLEFRGEFPDEMCMRYHALSICCREKMW